MSNEHHLSPVRICDWLHSYKHGFEERRGGMKAEEAFATINRENIRPGLDERKMLVEMKNRERDLQRILNKYTPSGAIIPLEEQEQIRILEEKIADLYKKTHFGSGYHINKAPGNVNRIVYETPYHKIEDYVSKVAKDYRMSHADAKAAVARIVRGNSFLNYARPQMSPYEPGTKHYNPRAPMITDAVLDDSYIQFVDRLFKASHTMPPPLPTASSKEMTDGQRYLARFEKNGKGNIQSRRGFNINNVSDDTLDELIARLEFHNREKVRGRALTEKEKEQIVYLKEARKAPSGSVDRTNNVKYAYPDWWKVKPPVKEKDADAEDIVLEEKEGKGGAMPPSQKLRQIRRDFLNLSKSKQDKLNKGFKKIYKETGTTNAFLTILDKRIANPSATAVEEIEDSIDEVSRSMSFLRDEEEDDMGETLIHGRGVGGMDPDPMPHEYLSTGELINKMEALLSGEDPISGIDDYKLSHMAKMFIYIANKRLPLLLKHKETVFHDKLFKLIHKLSIKRLVWLNKGLGSPTEVGKGRGSPEADAKKAEYNDTVAKIKEYENNRSYNVRSLPALSNNEGWKTWAFSIRAKEGTEVANAKYKEAREALANYEKLLAKRKELSDWSKNQAPTEVGKGSGNREDILLKLNQAKAYLKSAENASGSPEDKAKGIAHWKYQIAGLEDQVKQVKISDEEIKLADIEYQKKLADQQASSATRANQVAQRKKQMDDEIAAAKAKAKQR